MKIYDLQRGAGKTCKAVLLSSKKQIPILVHNISAKKIVRETAKRLGVNIPEPIAVCELKSQCGKRFNNSEYIIDEGDEVIKALIAPASQHSLLNPVMMTISSDDVELLRRKDMRTEKIIFKSISYEETEVIFDYYGDTVYLAFHRKDVPEICRRVKDVYVSLHRYDVEIPEKITAFAKADVYETLTTEYLVAPGKKLIDVFTNNGIAIHKIG